MAKLIFIDEKFHGQCYELKREKTQIGRGEQNHLIIPDASVSISHCMILANGPEVLVCELDSSNGTYVDDQRVEKQLQIKSGQTLRIGAATARLELGDHEEFTDAEEMTAVLGYRRALQTMPAPASAEEASAIRLQSPYPANAEEPTVTLKRPPAPVPPRTGNPGATSAPPPPPTSRVNKVGLIALLLLLAAIAAWWLWRMK